MNSCQQLLIPMGKVAEAILHLEAAPTTPATQARIKELTTQLEALTVDFLNCQKRAAETRK